MRFIEKSKIALNAFENAINAAGHYNNLHRYQKQNILKILIEEQKGLCAYCMQRISLNDATLEHLVCQSHNSALDLEYLNLFAVCKGNEGKIQSSHCDKYRANGAYNSYFFPILLFQKSTTTGWNSVNPFFDIEFNPKTQFVSGKLLGNKTNVDGFPNIKINVESAIKVLNLNSEKLVSARRYKWDSVKKNQLKLGLNWEELFEYYLNNAPTDFHEFVLMAIRKQVNP